MKTFDKLVKGLDPVADAFAGTVYSDVVSLKGHKEAHFIVYKGVGLTGVSKITVEACSNFTPSAQIAVPFRYQKITSGDTEGVLTECADTGFDTDAGSSQLYKVIVNANDIISTGYSKVRLKMVESVDSPVVGCILVELKEPAVDKSIQNTVIA